MNKKVFIFLIVILVIIFVIAIIVFSQIQVDKTEIEAQNFAIAKVKEASDLSFFPDKPGTTEGIIYGGGPAPGIEVPGEFETVVEKESEGIYIVTFTERWNSSDFHYEGEDASVLSHYFKFRVSENGVEDIEEGGSFPPQAVK